MPREVTLEEVQEADLRLLDHLHAFCSENGIRYYLGYGSLLGAVRHGGFIPWDDDIDILMPRSDFDRFLDLYGRAGDEQHIRLLKPCEEGLAIGWAKLLDTRTRYNNEKYDLPDYYGLTIDIFPLDEARSRFRHTIVSLQSFVRQAKLVDSARRQAGRRGASKLKAAVARMIPLGLCTRERQERLMKTDRKSTHLLNYFGVYGYDKERVPREWYGEPQLMQFGETRKYYAPAQPESLLASWYGPDWRTPVQNPRHAELFWRD